MSRKRLALILIVLALVASALLFRRPIQTWAATQSCVRSARDHYPNIATLQNAPALDAYLEQARLQCRATVAQDYFEQATSAEARQEQGAALIALYSELIAAENGQAWRPQRAAVYTALGDYQEALADYNFLLVHDPENYWVLERRGELHFNMGQFEQALADYQALYETARRDPANSNAYLERIEARIQAIEAES